MERDSVGILDFEVWNRTVLAFSGLRPYVDALAPFTENGKFLTKV